MRIERGGFMNGMIIVGHAMFMLFIMLLFGKFVTGLTDGILWFLTSSIMMISSMYLLKYWEKGYHSWNPYA